MAKAAGKKKKTDPAVNYASAVAELKANGPQRLYLLWGAEDYLREQFLAQIKALCIPGGEDDFSYHRFNGSPDLPKLADAVDAMPFLTDRTLVEIRDFDTNQVPEAELTALLKILEDVPDYCTVVFVEGPEFTPDGRMKLNKALKKNGQMLQFAQQDSKSLVNWVARRFAAWEKRVTVADAEYLIQITGGLMNRMIPEIEKISSFAAAPEITRADIDAVTQKTPDAVVFEMTDLLAQGDRNGAMRKLSELLSVKDSNPIALLAVLGQQMRRLYAAKLAQEARMSLPDTMELCGVEYDFIVQKLQRSARRFSLAALERAVAGCAEADYAMKRSRGDKVALLEELMLSIMAEVGA